MEEIIRQKCEEAGISPDILTENEKFKLRKEIEAEQQGKVVLDSVLGSKAVLDRAFRSE